MRWKPSTERKRSGAAMVEFALMLPVLTFAMVAAGDFARIFYYDQTIINCARNGAIYLSDPYAPIVATYPGGYKDAVLADAKDLKPVLTTSDISSANTTDANGNPCVAVTVKYQFPTLTSYLGFSSVKLSQ